MVFSNNGYDPLPQNYSGQGADMGRKQNTRIPIAGLRELLAHERGLLAARPKPVDPRDAQEYEANRLKAFDAALAAAGVKAEDMDVVREAAMANYGDRPDDPGKGFLSATPGEQAAFIAKNIQPLIRLRDVINANSAEGLRSNLLPDDLVEDDLAFSETRFGKDYYGWWNTGADGLRTRDGRFISKRLLEGDDAPFGNDLDVKAKVKWALQNGAARLRAEQEKAARGG
jgi:hypothetical protein